MHSWTERRDRGRVCRRTFAATRGTPFCRLQSAAALVTLVLTLLSHGCPLQAIVAAFGLDERTVAAWLGRAGDHCPQVHKHLVLRGQVELRRVQADELWGTLVGQRVWLAMALAAPTRRWLGGVLRPRRDTALITALVPPVRAGACSSAILVRVDGLASDGTAFLRVFPEPVRTGRRGRPRRAGEPGVLIGQVGKRSAPRRVVSVRQRVVRGTTAAIAAVLAATATGTGIHTADSERLNATFRRHPAPLVRRGRALAHTAATLPAGMRLGGSSDNLCWPHGSLRLAAPAESGRTGRERTPATAAGSTDHRWTLSELLDHRVPLPARLAPTRRGRPPKRLAEPVLLAA